MPPKRNRNRKLLKISTTPRSVSARYSPKSSTPKKQKLELYLIITKSTHPAGITATISKTRPTGPLVRHSPMLSQTSMMNRPMAVPVKARKNAKRDSKSLESSPSQSGSMKRKVKKEMPEKADTPVPNAHTQLTSVSPENQKSIKPMKSEERKPKRLKSSAELLLDIDTAADSNYIFTADQVSWASSMLSLHLDTLKSIEETLISEIQPYFPYGEEFVVNENTPLDSDHYLVGLARGVDSWESCCGKEYMQADIELEDSHCYQASTVDLAGIVDMLNSIEQSRFRIRGANLLLQDLPEEPIESESEESADEEEDEDSGDSEEEIGELPIMVEVVAPSVAAFWPDADESEYETESSEDEAIPTWNVEED